VKLELDFHVSILPPPGGSVLQRSFIASGDGSIDGANLELVASVQDNAMTCDTLRGRGYSVWALPEPGLRERLAGEIRRRNAILWEPHLTVIAGMDGDPDGLMVRMRELGERLHGRPIHVEIGAAEVGPDPFRCVYLSARSTSRAFDDLLLEASRIFGQPALSAEATHLSLVYGDLALAERERIADEIGGRYAGTCAIFALSLYRTEGPLSSWLSVGEVPLR
jgi:hypothetical protein